MARQQDFGACGGASPGDGGEEAVWARRLSENRALLVNCVIKQEVSDLQRARRLGDFTCNERVPNFINGQCKAVDI